jgi:hypothetical protein
MGTLSKQNRDKTKQYYYNDRQSFSILYPLLKVPKAVDMDLLGVRDCPACVLTFNLQSFCVVMSLFVYLGAASRRRLASILLPIIDMKVITMSMNCACI